MSARSFIILLLVFPLGIAEAVRRPKHHQRKPAALAVASSEAMVILQAEANRESPSKKLVALTKHSSFKIAQAAVLALGRIGGAEGVEPLAGVLNKRNQDLRIAAAFSLGLIGGDVALKILGQHSEMHKEGKVTGMILSAMGRAGKQATVPLLTKVILSSQDKDVLFGAAHGLGFLWSQDSAQWSVPPKLLAKLASLSATRFPYSVAAAFALSRFKGSFGPLTAVELGDVYQNAENGEARVYLIRALASMKAPAAESILVSALSAPSTTIAIKIECAKGLGLQSFAENIGKVLIDAAQDPNPALAVSALEAIGSFDLGANSLAKGLESIVNGTASVWVRATALKSLARIHPELARKNVLSVWVSPTSSGQLKAAAAYGLARMADSSDLDTLSEWLIVAPTPVVVEALDGLSIHGEEKITPSLKVTLKKLLERADLGITTQVASIVQQNRWTEFVPVLATVYQFFNSPEQVEPKVAILNAIAVAGTSVNLPELQLALQDPSQPVSAAAAKAIEAITGQSSAIGRSVGLAVNSRYPVELPSQEQISRAVGAQVRVVTTKGEMLFKLLPTAPLTTSLFFKWAKENFYAGMIFHRVVPGFVVQGGDPRGDGYGGPDFLIRDEVSLVRHTRGTVGIATAGKDTGGCQFFINLGPNLHLDGRYTVFAEMVKGIDVADRLEVGDQILSTKVL